MTYKYPNVDLASPDVTKGLPHSEYEFEVPPFMAQLVDAVATKYPSWLLRGLGRSVISDKLVHINSFEVLNNDNPRTIVGKIGVTKRYNPRGGSELVYSVSCQRLAMARERGHQLMSKDVKIAMKAIKEHFTPLPLAERVDQVRSEAYDFARSLESRYANAAYKNRVSVYPLIQRFIRSNWETFIATLEPTERRDVEELLDQESAHESIKDFNAMFSSSKVLTLLTEDDKYVVQYSGALSRWDSSELPDEVRRRVGQLKLTDKHVFVEGVGLKTDKGFVIMLPEGFNNAVPAL
jgi:hypothetical protein